MRGRRRRAPHGGGLQRGRDAGRRPRRLHQLHDLRRQEAARLSTRGRQDRRGNDQELFLWTYYPTDDCSSASTGSTIFDFTGDGRPEALYSDEQKLRIFNGPDGTVLFETCNTTGTLQEYPLVVDVDNDGHADIVVVSNAYAIGDSYIACQEVDGGPMGSSGVRVFSDANMSWVRTRAIWNEHPYHITNVNDDGTIPAKELPELDPAGARQLPPEQAAWLRVRGAGRGRLDPTEL